MEQKFEMEYNKLLLTADSRLCQIPSWFGREIVCKTDKKRLAYIEIPLMSFDHFGLKKQKKKAHLKYGVKKYK